MTCFHNRTEEQRHFKFWECVKGSLYKLSHCQRHNNSLVLSFIIRKTHIFPKKRTFGTVCDLLHLQKNIRPKQLFKVDNFASMVGLKILTNHQPQNENSAFLLFTCLSFDDSIKLQLQNGEYTSALIFQLFGFTKHEFLTRQNNYWVRIIFPVWFLLVRREGHQKMNGQCSKAKACA